MQNEQEMSYESAPKITIEKLSEANFDAAEAVRLQSWLDTYEKPKYGVTRDWLEARIRDQQSPEKIATRRHRLKNPHSRGIVATINDEVVGVAWPFVDKDDNQYVGSLYTDKKWHGKGVGAALMAQIIAQFDPTKPIELEVAAYNGRAKKFYEKQGFEYVPESDGLFEGVMPVVKMVRKGDEQ